jgi:uncharacterized protein YbgA (DUF1722 family)/uncharacterized protein YbbK (DUF523 family)
MIFLRCHGLLVKPWLTTLLFNIVSYGWRKNNIHGSRVASNPWHAWGKHVLRTFAKPRIVVSRCLGFATCRWDGDRISDDLVERMKPFVEFHPVCPEMELGLGCPRDPIRVIAGEAGLRLVQPSTGRDLTEPMTTFARQFVAGLGPVDGFILKARSPSCGIEGVKIFAGPNNEEPEARGRGFFAAAVLDAFPDSPIEDEGRLTDVAVREHFLTRLFTLAEFRAVAGSGTIRDLVRFHAVSKGLLMAYHEAEMRAMGRIVANHEHKADADVFAEYGRHLSRALARPPRFTSIINVLTHALGYVSDHLSSGEKAFFLDALEKYRAGKAPLSACTALVKAWAVRFDVPALSDQTYLEPYPESLVDITDSGKGRDV